MNRHNNEFEILELLYRYKSDIDKVILPRLELYKTKSRETLTDACLICYRPYNEADRSYACEECYELCDEIERKWDDSKPYDGPYSCKRCISDICDECWDCEINYENVLENILSTIYNIDKTIFKDLLNKLNPNNKFLDICKDSDGEYDLDVDVDYNVYVSKN